MVITTTELNQLIKNEKFQDLLGDLSETILDSILEDEIIKDIPIFGLIFKGRNLYATIQDKLFTKKLLTFLLEIKDISQLQRIEQIEKIESDSKYHTKVGEKILHIVNQAEDADKAKYLGALFCAFLKEQLSYESFLKATYCINNTNLTSLKEFLENKYYIISEAPMHFAEDFLTTGLLTLNINDPKRDINGELKINLKITKTGKLIYDILGVKRFPKLS